MIKVFFTRNEVFIMKYGILLVDGVFEREIYDNC